MQAEPSLISMYQNIKSIARDLDLDEDETIEKKLDISFEQINKKLCALVLENQRYLHIIKWQSYLTAKKHFFYFNIWQ